MDNENQTNTGQPAPGPAETAAPAPAPAPDASTGGQGLFQKNPGLKTLVGVAGIAVFLLAAIALRNNYFDKLEGTGADACYGYDCKPTVVLGGRTFGTGYDTSFSYGTLTIRRGQPIELTWHGTNVDKCVADWTDFNGTYYPPTYYETRITTSQTFSVLCTNNDQRATVRGSLNVQVTR